MPGQGCTSGQKGSSRHAQHTLHGVLQVLYSAILFFGYVWILGAILFVLLKFVFKSEVSLPQIWCTYGEPWTPREGCYSQMCDQP